MNKYLKLFLLTVTGSILGFGYYYFIGCDSGCAISSSWVNSTLYGTAIGLIAGFPTKEKIKK